MISLTRKRRGHSPGCCVIFVGSCWSQKPVYERQKFILVPSCNPNCFIINAENQRGSWDCFVGSLFNMPTTVPIFELGKGTVTRSKINCDEGLENISNCPPVSTTFSVFQVRGKLKSKLSSRSSNKDRTKTLKDFRPFPSDFNFPIFSRVKS